MAKMALPAIIMVKGRGKRRLFCREREMPPDRGGLILSISVSGKGDAFGLATEVSG
jgi:hypothetical protein